MSAWVDYRKLRESVDFAAVLNYYRVEYKRKGTQVQAFCPLPMHEGHQNSPAFSASLEKRIFQCFGCGAQGNVLDFIARMEKLNPRESNEFRRAALLAQERFCGASSPQAREFPALPPRPSITRVPPKKQAERILPATLINEPLDFELKNLDLKPQYLRTRGFTERTIAHFGLGYCSKGMFSGRVVIPLHDMMGRLIGYAGRLIYDDAIDEENPKYLFPSKRERNGTVLEFAKSLFVYNGHRITSPETDLIIVQGFPSVWWLWQHGYQNVVAIMGSTCSVDQARIVIDLVSPSGRVWFLTDGNKTGQGCAAQLFSHVGPERFCKLVKLHEGQPTDCVGEELASVLKWEIIA